MSDPPKITIDTSMGSLPESPSHIESPTNTSNKKHDAGVKSVEEYGLEARQHLDECSTKGSNDKLYNRSQDELNCLMDPKNIYVLQELGGIEGLSKSLDTSLTQGLSQSADHSERIEQFGRNVLPERKAKPLWKLMWIAMQDKVLIILSIAAVVSLALGLYETFGQPPEYDSEGREMPKVDWVEGVAIIVAVLIVVVVGAVNDWQKERQFVKLNKKKESRMIKAVRDGAPAEVSIYDIMVGDVLMVEPGEMIPADGVLIKGYDVKCDESSATGESDTLSKHEAHQVLTSCLSKESHHQAFDPMDKKVDVFMLSGGKVLGGTGTYLVTAVGPNSLYGRTMMSLQDDPEATPLQEKLNSIAEGIAKVGILAAIILFIALFIRFCTKLKGSDETPAQKGNDFLNIFITAVTIIVVAVPEGLPLAVTLALAFATTRMVKDNNLVRVLKSCETMGGATTVCSDKTGTLTQNRMTVVAGTLGKNAKFGVTHGQETDMSLLQGGAAAGAEPQSNGAADAAKQDVDDADDTQPEDGVQHPEQVLEKLPQDKFKLLLDSIAVNSSAFESTNPDDPEKFVGSKTETALLGFATEFMGLGGLEEYRNKQNVEQVYPFDSAKKFMGTVIGDGNGGHYVLVKGASEVVLSKCTQIFDLDSQQERAITDSDIESVKASIDEYANKSLRTLGLVYRHVKQLPDHADKATREKELFHDFVFLTVVGIKDPLRPGVKQAVADCHTAGVVVRMVTGDNIHTARAIAIDCGILTGEDDDAIVMEGPVFRKLDMFEKRKIVPKLRVLARSSPEDKRKLVSILKSQGEVVAVTGDGTNDAPALKLADVGFSMGIAGTEVAKEASEIILMDDNFGSIVKAIMWGRTVNDAVKKFLQFQLTVNVTAVLLTFVSAVASSDNKSVLTAVQLLWVNLIMDTFAALALATDPPSPSVLKRNPDSRTDSLINVVMWKMILGQAVVQLVITFILHFAGYQMFHAAADDAYKRTQIDAMVFNTFVWLQFFNIFVNRRLDNRANIFEGISRNPFFIAIVCIIGGVQVLIMFVGGAAFTVRRQTGVQWAVALVCGFLSIPAAVVIRKIPDSWVLKLYPRGLVRWCNRLIFRQKDKPDIVVDEETTVGNTHSYKWNPAIEQVREELQFLKRYRGGRLSNLRFKRRNFYQQWKDTFSPGTTTPSSSMHDIAHSPSTLNGAHTPPQAHTSSGGSFLTVPGTPGRRRYSSGSSTIGALTMVPSIIGGAVGGWSPMQSTLPSPVNGPEPDESESDERPAVPKLNLPDE